MEQEYFLFIFAIIGLLFAFFIYLFLKNKSQGDDKMKEISNIIKEGSKTYLIKQYKILSVVIIFVSIFLGIFINLGTGIAFILGAFFSSITGFFGMMVATSSNARTAEGCKKNLNQGLRIAFFSGVIMGLTVVSLGLIGILFSYILFNDLEILFGFGFGASLIALFARVGGGIYTKAADIGADIVGKVELNLPEDDPRNPAVIADNVGDNVGDVAGMGADLFESYVQSIIAAMSLGFIFFGSIGLKGALFPLLIAGLGIIASILGMFFVRTGYKNPYNALNKGVIVSTIFIIIFSYFAVYIILGSENLNIFYSILTGIFTGGLIGISTQYYTSDNKKPVISIAKSSRTGPATNIIAGFSTGMISTIIPILTIVFSIILSYNLAGLFGISIAAVGMLSTLGITLATDTYGPIADNAAGIAQMANLKKEVRKKAESLDAIGNTTAAIGKGFAIGSAALTTLALFSVFGEKSGLSVINILSPIVLGGAFIGSLLPFVFSSLTINSVGRTSYKMVKEVRMQFNKDKGLLKGNRKPDYKKPIEISTIAALKEMILPCTIAALTPILVGSILGIKALGGLLLGTTTTGLLLAITLSNSGGAWDNAKKYIEKGNFGGKGSITHKAAIIGDTVGDPFKDTSGPSLNILIKIVSIISLLFVIIYQ